MIASNAHEHTRFSVDCRLAHPSFADNAPKCTKRGLLNSHQVLPNPRLPCNPTIFKAIPHQIYIDIYQTTSGVFASNKCEIQK